MGEKSGTEKKMGDLDRSGLGERLWIGDRVSGVSKVRLRGLILNDPQLAPIVIPFYSVWAWSKETISVPHGPGGDRSRPSRQEEDVLFLLCFQTAKALIVYDF